MLGILFVRWLSLSAGQIAFKHSRSSDLNLHDVLLVNISLSLVVNDQKKCSKRFELWQNIITNSACSVEGT